MPHNDDFVEGNVVADIPVFGGLGVEIVERFVRDVHAVGAEPHGAEFEERFEEVVIGFCAGARFCRPRHRLEFNPAPSQFVAVRADEFRSRAEVAVGVARYVEVKAVNSAKILFA